MRNGAMFYNCNTTQFQDEEMQTVSAKIISIVGTRLSGSLEYLQFTLYSNNKTNDEYTCKS